ncbi:hypothetical protein [Micromonospora sp. NPDC048898]|uniref:hypothetical protein n=1 Tax=Micromonospora sp. NPDC048898 TaxID=3364260 RepID=UPI00371802F4
MLTVGDRFPEYELSVCASLDANKAFDVSEVLRVLDALQTDELCPCNWNRGGGTLDANALLAGAGV